MVDNDEKQSVSPNSLFSTVGYWFKKDPDDKYNPLFIGFGLVVMVLCLYRSMQATPLTFQAFCWFVAAVTAISLPIISTVDGYRKTLFIVIAIIGAGALLL